MQVNELFSVIVFMSVLVADDFTIFYLVSRPETALTTLASRESVHVLTSHISIIVLHAWLLLDVIVKFARL
jgi:hypothetical protein